MHIGILGVGNIGAILTRRLSAAGHQVKVANSRGPETIPDDVLSTGAQAVDARSVVTGVDVLIVSIPLARIPDIAGLLDELPEAAVVIDTSNYYPFRDGQIAALDAGQPESLWVVEQLGRPVVKAWNAIIAGSFDTKAAPPGSAGRIAVPVAADSDAHRAVALQLVDETGFDPYDSGTLADSWRQQPGAPAYCTDLTAQELPHALDTADRSRLPHRRDLSLTVISALADDPSADLGGDALVRLNRLLYTI